jgi:GNAT superfamily N-acetyltransferase
MLPVSLRPAASTDLTLIAVLNGQLGYAAAAESLAARLQIILASERDHLQVAVLPDGHVVGWIHAQLVQWLESPYRAEIGGLVVDEAARRQGVGRILVNGVRQWAAAHGAMELSVRCQIHRVEAHAFYAAQGFIRTKSQHVFRRPVA